MLRTIQLLTDSLKIHIPMMRSSICKVGPVDTELVSLACTGEEQELTRQLQCRQKVERWRG
jgi:hypothetical protein